MVFLKEFFEKVDFEKKSADNKKYAKLPSRQRVNNEITTLVNSENEVGRAKNRNILLNRECAPCSLILVFTVSLSDFLIVAVYSFMLVKF